MRTEEQEREYQATMEEESMSQGEYMAAAVRQWAGAYGEERPDDRWVLSPFDTWENNPYWNGTDPDQPHPDDEYAIEEYYVVGQHAVNLYLNHIENESDKAAVGWIFDDARRFADEVGADEQDLPF